MPIRRIAGTDTEYHLICFDERGVEHPEPDGSLTSDGIRALLADKSAGITDVFLASHGWKGDVPAAIEQYDRWVGEMARASADRATALRVRPGFKALVIGFHWPSLPWGDEAPAAGGGVLSGSAGTSSSVAADTTTGTAGIDRNVDLYAARIADTPAARAALRAILTAAQQERRAAELPTEVREAYARLYAESGLATGTVDAPPGSDYERWDPDALYQEARGTATTTAPATPGVLGGLDSVREALLMPLRQMSFWKMKDRARQVGETGGHRLLRQIQGAAGPEVRMHIMGHSFGCIVASASLTGAAGTQPLAWPVDSLFLVQGALSLWSYCGDIPYAAGKSGYFRRVIADGLVRGPIVTTRSTYDTAVGALYSKAAGVARQFVLDDNPFPKYGGVGTFGAQGLGKVASDMPIQPVTASYGFAPGRVYNVEASAVIKNGGGLSGAHSDIAHPEVAHVMWEAALAG